MEAPFDVFLSHNSKDKPAVRQLAEALQRRGLKVWLDEWELVPGRPWLEALEEIIQTTRSAAVLVGKDGLGPWEIPEMRGCLSEFVSRKLPVIPVLLSDAPSQPNLPLFLKGFTWVDLRAGGLSDANLDRLEWGITGRRPSSRPEPEPVPEPIPQKPSGNQVIGRKAKRGWLMGLAAVIFTGLLLGVIYKISTLPSPPSSVVNPPDSSKPASPSATQPLVTNPEPVSPTKDLALAPGKEFQDKLKDGTLGPEMVVIPAGSFLMGSPPDEPGHSDDERQHKVKVKAFAIGKYEVTFEEYDHFATATGREKPADEGWGRGRRPVINVSWYDAVAYAEWLSAQTGQHYRLPTEAEWEYAARAGTTTPFYFGDTINTDQANCGNGRGKTVEVGRFPANPWGLYDVHGNVWEWTCSRYDKDYDGSEQWCLLSESATGPVALRGGSWSSGPKWLRVAARYRFLSRGGFRLARMNPPEPSKPASPSATQPLVTNPEPVSPTTGPALMPGREFQDKLKDGTLGPEMVKIRGGRFLMGSPPDEKERNEDERQHEVQVADFAIGKYEVTIEQFKKFVEATNYQTEAEKSGGCYYWTRSGWRPDTGKNWRNPGFSQSNDHPVVCVSWHDAMAYMDWLSKQTGQDYRLPTEAEWEYAARAGTTAARYWGDDPDKGCTFANGADQTAEAQFQWITNIMKCQDGYAYTAPVSRYQPNAFGLYDMLGNAWEWTCSEYDNYGGKEMDCISNDGNGVVRGGSWKDVPRKLRGAARSWNSPYAGTCDGSFRLART